MLSRKDKYRLKRNRGWVRFKNSKKVVRTIVQYIVLIVIGYSAVNAVISFSNYITPDKTKWVNYDNFIAISYFGISRNKTGEHISQKELNAQLHVLKQLGYETISQQDVYDFYTKNKPLPEKALYLAFEDGRNDSALFSTKILEQLNYKATMLSYANKLENAEGKFLTPKAMLEMASNGYWELGTNGYRLAYINVEEKDGAYYELITQNEFYELDAPIRYNHFLMDFIRDRNNIPLENKDEMQLRINQDYDYIARDYRNSLGYVPQTYMIMHADSLYNTMNPLIEEVNDKRIRDMFAIHFNREGYMLNSINVDRYNLTRVQPAPYWRTNHLLMKLQLDTGKAVQFVTGHVDQTSKWTVENGVTQFLDEEIVLTTRPNAKATMYISELKLEGLFSLEVTLGGHTSGVQYIELGHSKDNTVQLRLRMQEHMVFLEEVDASGKIERKLAVKGRNKVMDEVPLTIRVENQSISLDIGHQTVMENEPIDTRISEWIIAFSAESLRDDNRWEDEGNFIYDGIFKSIQVKQLQVDGEKDTLLFSNRLLGAKRALYMIETLYNKAIDWGIETF